MKAVFLLVAVALLCHAQLSSAQLLPLPLPVSLAVVQSILAAVVAAVVALLNGVVCSVAYVIDALIIAVNINNYSIF